MAAVIEVVVALGDEEGGHQHDQWALAERRMTLTTPP
jgi:hypothetical protein